MTEPVSITKALDITPTALVKSTSSFLKGLLVTLVIVAIGWGIYIVAIKPHTHPVPTTTQTGTITNNYINPTADQLVNIIQDQVKKQSKKFFLGVRLFGFDLGISR